MYYVYTAMPHIVYTKYIYIGCRAIIVYIYICDVALAGYLICSVVGSSPLGSLQLFNGKHLLG